MRRSPISAANDCPTTDVVFVGGQISRVGTNVRSLSDVGEQLAPAAAAAAAAGA